MGSNALKYKIEVLDKASRELKQIAKEMGVLDSKAKKTKPSMNDMAGSLMKFAKGGIITAAVIGGVRAMHRTFTDLTNAYKVQEQAEARLAGALRATGLSVQGSLPGLTQLASELQSVTLYGDEATIAAQSLLVSIGGLDEDGVTEILPGIMDLATAMGMDLNSAASLVAKTVNSSMNALSRYGIQIDTSGSKSEKLAELTEVLSDKFGGMAEAAADTATGSIDQLSMAYGDLKEQLGRSIADGFEPVGNWLTRIIEKMTEAKKAANDYKDSLDKVESGTGSLSDEMIVALGKMDRLRSQREVLTAKERTATATAGTGGGGYITYSDVDKAMASKLDEQIRALGNTIQSIQMTINGQKQLAEASSEADKKKAEEDKRIADINKRYIDQWQTILKMQEDMKSPLQKEADALLEQMSQIQLAWGEGSKYEEARTELLKKLNGEYEGIIAQIKNQSVDYSDLTSGLDDPFLSDSQKKDLSNIKDPLAGSSLDRIMNSLAPVADMFTSMLPSLSSLTAILNPFQVVMDGLFKTIQPIVDTLLKPLLGALYIVGVAIGEMLAPLLMALAPVIEVLSEAFVWLYNKILRPIGNALIGLFNIVFNAIAGVANGLIAIYNAFVRKSKEKDQVAYRDLKAGQLLEITTADLNAYGNDAYGNDALEFDGTAPGTGANYTAGRSITVNVQINTEVIAGDNGMRDLSLMIRDEIYAAEALGY